jgi:hypothetical protein
MNSYKKKHILFHYFYPCPKEKGKKMRELEIEGKRERFCGGGELGAGCGSRKSMNMRENEEFQPLVCFFFFFQLFYLNGPPYPYFLTHFDFDSSSAHLFLLGN